MKISRAIGSVVALGGASVSYYLLSNKSLGEELSNSIDEIQRPEIQVSDTSFYEENSHNLSSINSVNAALPIRSNYSNNFKHNQADSIVDLIKDYTVKLDLPCNWGTGWILDYVIPENGKYPTKWFIGTNFHVVNAFNFSSTPSKYEQNLPSFWKSSLSGYSESCLQQRNQKNSEILIGKENRDNKWTMAWVKVENPKLFWNAQNLFEKNSYKNIQNYFYDFAVIEVDFDSENSARWATDDFHHKYGKEQTNSEKIIDIFAENPASKWEWEKRNNDDLRYYTGGYPIDGSKNENVMKFSSVKFGKSSQIDSIGSPAYKIDWESEYRREYSLTGYHFWLENFGMEQGASGSIAISGKKKFLGLYSSISNDKQKGTVQPIRSKAINFPDSEISTVPKYDLILGSSGQKSSYREQLQKHYKDKKTFLRQLGLDSKASNIN